MTELLLKHFADLLKHDPLRISRLASDRSCRRPSGGRMFEAAVLHLLQADHSTGLAGHAKRRSQSPPRKDGRNAWGRRGSGEIRFMVGGERPKADHVGFLVK